MSRKSKSLPKKTSIIKPFELLQLSGFHSVHLRTLNYFDGFVWRPTLPDHPMCWYLAISESASTLLFKQGVRLF